MLHALAEGLRPRTVKVYTDYAALLQDGDIDAVDLVVPPYLHACAALCPCPAASGSGSGPVCDCTRRCAGSEYAIAAARAGKHCYCEKPMTDSVSAARAMIEAATTAGTTLMVGESYHFHATHQLAHTLVQAGEIGEVREIEMWKGGWQFGPRAPAGSAAAWRSHPELSGGGAFPWTIDHGLYAHPPVYFISQRYYYH